MNDVWISCWLDIFDTTMPPLRWFDEPTIISATGVSENAD